MNNPQNPEHPILIVIRGLPGSGKSYIARALQKSLGEDDVVLLDPDATDYKSKAYADHVKAQIEEGVDPKLHAYRFLRAQAYDGIAAHKIVIWNQAFTNLEIFNKMIIRLQDHAAACNTTLPVLVVEVTVDPDVAKARIAKRKQEGGHDVPDDAFTRFITDYFSFREHGYNVVALQGEDDVAASVAAIEQALQSL